MRPAADQLAKGIVLLVVCVWLAGCEGKKPTPAQVKPIGPLAVHRANAPTRVFSGEEETPTTSYAFEGANGSVRVTMEVETFSNPSSATPLSLNDVLFKAEGEGRISVAFKRPWPEHPNGRVTIRCVSGSEESEAEFEPELWYHQPSAIVTFESPLGELSNPVVEGKEVLLGHYVARNTPREIRVSFKARFSKDPAPPRTKAGMKPTR